MIRKFKNEESVIEAVQWTGKNLKEIINFIGLHPSAKKWTWEEYKKIVEKEGLKIFTRKGTMMADINDWIIKGIRGVSYPCKPDVFEKTYEIIKEKQ